MTIFVSVPMHGRTDEEVWEDIMKAREDIPKLLPGEFCYTIMDNFGCRDDRKNGRLYYLGNAIQMMDLADVVYFCQGWEKSNGCRIEHEICELYGIQRIEA